MNTSRNLVHVNSSEPQLGFGLPTVKVHTPRTVLVSKQHQSLEVKIPKERLIRYEH